MIVLYIIIGIIVLIGIYVFLTYNSFIKTRNLVEEVFSTMDIYLKKRWDLIPNLVEVVKGYADYEKETLEQVTTLRTKTYDNMSMDQKIDVNEKMTREVSKLLAVAENYPDLKANQNFSDLSKELANVENDIANSRKYYNGTVRNLNNKVQMFPSNIVANMFNFKAVKMFEVAPEEKNNVKVDFKNE